MNRYNFVLILGFLSLSFTVSAQNSATTQQGAFTPYSPSLKEASYTLQAGAYKNKAQADRVKTLLLPSSADSEVVLHQGLYKIWFRGLTARKLEDKALSLKKAAIASKDPSLIYDMDMLYKRFEGLAEHNELDDYVTKGDLYKIVEGSRSNKGVITKKMLDDLLLIF